MSAGRACRPLPAAWRSAQHVHPEKSPSDLRLRPHPFGPLLVTFTSGRPVLRRPRSTRSSAGAFWPMAASHPSSVLAPPSPWRRRQPCRCRGACPCAGCNTDEGSKRTTDDYPARGVRARCNHGCNIVRGQDDKALLSHECFHPWSHRARTSSTRLAAWSRKSSEHFASAMRCPTREKPCRMSSTLARVLAAAELHMVRGHRVLRAGEAAARLEKHGQSMRANA